MLRGIGCYETSMALAKEPVNDNHPKERDGYRVICPAHSPSAPRIVAAELGERYVKPVGDLPDDNIGIGMQRQRLFKIFRP